MLQSLSIKIEGPRKRELSEGERVINIGTYISPELMYTYSLMIIELSE
jgi:hypothetical protein